jgi:Xaa-Pro aminopeptidase
MRYDPIQKDLFVQNRRRLAELLPPKSLAVVNNNDMLPTNADGVFRLHPNSDLFYLSGVEQEESILLLFPDAHEPRMREILFIRESSPLLETWEGRKLSKDEARKISGIERVEWLSSFANIFHTLMCECERVYLNANEHARASVAIQTREARFVNETRAQYPLHEYHRLARLLHELRSVKSEAELALLRRAIDITNDGFERVARFVKPGVNETEVEAEFAHEFIRRGGAFAYSPIIGSGANACALHYEANDAVCRDGELLLLDVASRYANYNADLTRVLPVNGRFSRRQRQVYHAVLRVFRAAAAMLRPGLLPSEWRKGVETAMEKELVDLKLLKMSEVKKQGPEKAALRRYYMHGIGHPIGLDVHDVAVPHAPMQAGWVVTCEPGIYIREEKIGVRIENMIQITEKGPVDLMPDIAIEADEIEALMAKPARRARRR